MLPLAESRQCFRLSIACRAQTEVATLSIVEAVAGAVGSSVNCLWSAADPTAPDAGSSPDFLQASFDKTHTLDVRGTDRPHGPCWLQAEDTGSFVLVSLAMLPVSVQDTAC
jgi:hypothetical protein